LSFLPYIYNAQRESYVNGLGLVRPMYYDWPEDDEAYAMDAAGNSVQYMFGDDMLVAPVVSAAGDDFPLTSKTIWLPQGDWIELATGSVLESPAGGKKLTKVR
jgi:alpha-glucosidase (family GH31 glycosyl hydrolase)